MNIREAAVARAVGVRQATDRPSQRRNADDSGTLSTCRATIHALDVRASKSGADEDRVTVTGYASVTETPYEMYDMFGPYTEVVSRDAFDATLETDPLVEFTVNHGAGGGMPMAHTRNGSLLLSVDDTGLRYEAQVNPARTDVADMLTALRDGHLAEASFKFRIDAGQWSPDYTEYRINAVDLERGDVSAVNFGANPNATSVVRSVEQAREPLAPVDVRAALLSIYLVD